MNDDRCVHVPTAPGQTVCTCLDRRMFLEFLVQMQAEYISVLLRRQNTGVPTLINVEVQ